MDVHWTLVLPIYIYGALPDVEIKQDDKFEEMWETIGTEIKSAFFTVLHVTPEYIVTVCLLAIQQKL